MTRRATRKPTRGSPRRRTCLHARTEAGHPRARGPAAARAGGALAALRARLAAERARDTRLRTKRHLRAAGSAIRPRARRPFGPGIRAQGGDAPDAVARLEPALSPDEDPAETARSAEGRRGADDGVEDAEHEPTPSRKPPTPPRACAATSSAPWPSLRLRAARTRRSTLRRYASPRANAELATRDLQAQKFETEKKEKELERLRRHLLDMEAEDDEKEERLSSREAEAARRAEGTIAAATEASGGPPRARRGARRRDPEGGARGEGRRARQPAARARALRRRGGERRAPRG